MDNIGPENGKKPHALFIRHKTTKSAAGFQNALEDEFAAALGLHAKVTIIDQDFDYGAVCDSVNPDFIILTSPGGNRAAPLTITNTNARPDIPRIGLLDQDPHDTARVSFFRLLDEMKIERFFAFGGGSIRQSPEMIGRAYTLGLFIDGEVFRDYGLEKNIPVSIFGGLIAPEFYNWRARNAVPVLNNFPTLLYAHPGYDAKIPPHRFPVSGVEYAKMLSRSRFSLADSTRFDCMVRKHLEIPACGAVLVTAESPSLQHYGFQDMQNCIMGDGMKLIEKIAAVAADPALYEHIRKNGHDLVYSRYMRHQWRGIVDWYECLKSLRPGETVQQQGELGPFAAAPAGAPALSGTLSDSEFTTTLKTALAKLLEGGNLDEVEASVQTATYRLHIGEPWLLAGLAALLRGDAPKARDLFLAPLTIRTQREGASCLDPEEIAWLLLAGTLNNDATLIKGARDVMKGMRHLSLRRMDWLLHSLEAGAALPLVPGMETREGGDRISTHWTGQLDLQTWLGLVGRILTAHGKKDFVPPVLEASHARSRAGVH